MIMNIKQPQLDQVIQNLYGSTLRKYKNVKNAYSIFTPYQNLKEEEILYFYIFKISSNNHLSEGTIQYALNRYNPFLSNVQFLEIQRHFNSVYYLLKSYKSLTTIDQLITLKKQCHEIIEKEQILKVIEFLIKIYKTKKWAELPEVSPKTIGKNQKDQLKICDYSLYFKSQGQMRSLTENICNCVNPMIKMALVKQSSIFLPIDNEYYRLQQYYGTNFANLIKRLVLDPLDNLEKQASLNGKGKKCNLKTIEDILNEYYKTSGQDLNVTLNDTYDDQEMRRQDYTGSKKFIDSDLLTTDTFKEAFIQKDSKNNTKRKNGAVIFALILTALVIIIGGIILWQYYTSSKTCQLGTFKAKDSNQCLPCTDHCLRCLSEQKNACISCQPRMFLILNDYNETKGPCENSCVSGIIIRGNLCLKNKQIIQNI